MKVALESAKLAETLKAIHHICCLSIDFRNILMQSLEIKPFECFFTQCYIRLYLLHMKVVKP